MNWEDAKALKHLQDSGFFDLMVTERKKRFLGEISGLTQDAEILKSVTEFIIAIQTINQLAIMPTTAGD